jgi:autotransporter-associated beta strand protein
LENRLAPATHTWTGASTTSSNWSDNANWTGGAPTSSESSVVLVFPAAARRTNTEDIAGLAIESLTFSANDYKVSGNQSLTVRNIVADAGVTGTDALNVNLTLDRVQATVSTAAGATLTLSGVISGTLGLSKTGGGTLILSGANTFGGGLSIDLGTVQAGAAYTLPSAGGVSVASGSTLDLNDFNQTIAGLVGMGNVKLGRAILTTDGEVGPPVFGFAGVISGTGGLTKVGSGVLWLSGNNTYTGATTVNAGTLQVTGDLSSSDVTVNYRAELRGSGTVKTITTAGSADVRPSVLREPCRAPGCTGPEFPATLGTALNAVFNPGSSFTVLLNGTSAGTDYSQLRSAGGVTLSGNPGLFVNLGFQPAIGDTFTIIDTTAVTGGIDGTFAGLPNGATFTVNNVTFRINYDFRVTLSVTTIQTQTTLISAPNPSGLGQPVALTAIVATIPPDRTPTGTVTFAEATPGPGVLISLGTSPLGVGGAARFSTSRLSSGTHTLIAFYNGDASFAASTSRAVAQTVNAGPPFTPNQRFVTQVYLDVLLRPPEPGGLSSWTAALDRGVSRTQVAAAIANSLEYKTLVVQGTYQTYLHRTGDPAGVNFWVRFLNSGGTISRMSEFFGSSPEYFQTRAGGTNSGFLDALYQDALRRGVDSGGRAGFGSALDAGRLSRGQVAAIVLRSPEYRQLLVQDLYQSFLGRAADPSGLQRFADALGRGVRRQDVLTIIIGSEEYFARL